MAGYMHKYRQVLTMGSTLLLVAVILLACPADGFSVGLAPSSLRSFGCWAAGTKPVLARAYVPNVKTAKFGPCMLETQNAEIASPSAELVKDRRVLVAGATGRVGSRVVEEVRLLITMHVVAFPITHTEIRRGRAVQSFRKVSRACGSHTNAYFDHHTRVTLIAHPRKS
jgi:hypothetical protein